MCSAPLSASTENTGPDWAARATPVVAQARRDGHRVVGHQRAHPARVGVAQRDVGHLVVHQRGLAAVTGRLHAVQDHAVDAPLLRVVVAVGVPLDGAVGVRNVGRGRLTLRTRCVGDGDARDAVFVGQPVGVQPVQAELRAQLARQALVGRRHRAAIQRHVGAADALQQRSALGGRQPARVGHVDDQVVDTARLLLQLGMAPAPVGRVVVEVEGAAQAGRWCPGNLRPFQSPLRPARRGSRGSVDNTPSRLRCSISTASGASTDITWSSAQARSFAASTPRCGCPGSA